MNVTYGKANENWRDLKTSLKNLDTRFLHKKIPGFDIFSYIKKSKCKYKNICKHLIK
jgi:hypothetical protein